MITVTPDDIPDSVTKLAETAPQELRLTTVGGLSQNAAATLLAHYWPAIREHFAQRLQEQNPDRDADFSDGVDWATDLIRSS